MKSKIAFQEFAFQNYRKQKDGKQNGIQKFKRILVGILEMKVTFLRIDFEDQFCNWIFFTNLFRIGKLKSKTRFLYSNQYLIV